MWINFLLSLFFSWTLSSVWIIFMEYLHAVQTAQLLNLHFLMHRSLIKFNVVCLLSIEIWRQMEDIQTFNVYLLVQRSLFKVVFMHVAWRCSPNVQLCCGSIEIWRQMNENINKRLMLIICFISFLLYFLEFIVLALYISIMQLLFLCVPFLIHYYSKWLFLNLP